jgi:hypothetical protein
VTFYDLVFGNQADRIEAKLDLVLQRQEAQMSAFSDAFDALTAQVTANTTVEASAVTLIQGLAAQIGQAAGDPAAVQALSDKLKTSADALASAITANTKPPAPAA